MCPLPNQTTGSLLLEREGMKPLFAIYSPEGTVGFGAVPTRLGGTLTYERWIALLLSQTSFLAPPVIFALSGLLHTVMFGCLDPLDAKRWYGTRSE